jgi:hypothetical protein
MSRTMAMGADASHPPVTVEFPVTIRYVYCTYPDASGRPFRTFG